MSSSTPVASAAALDDFLTEADVPVCLYFRADWAAQCTQMDSVTAALAKRYNKKVKFAQVDAEDASDVSERYDVSLVPTFVFLDHAGKVDDRFEGADVKEVTKRVKKLLESGLVRSPAEEASQKTETLNARIAALLKSAECIVFIKGVPDAPRCKFSRELVSLLADHNVDYASFDILSDDDVRQGLKEYSNWPTYPQLYVKGELLGGLDVLKEMMASGEFDKAVPKKAAAVPLEDRLKRLTTGADIMLFMKGVPGEPRCGFSSKIVQLFADLKIEYSSFDILTDNDVRQGLKKFSEWPTFPQVYIKGEFIGGLDIVQEMIEDESFHELLV